MKRTIMSYRSILFYVASFSCLLTLMATGSICYNQLVTRRKCIASVAITALGHPVSTGDGIAGAGWLLPLVAYAPIPALNRAGGGSSLHCARIPDAHCRHPNGDRHSGVPVGRNRTEKYLRIIREETERLRHDVETMLTLARADHNTLVLEPEPILVHELLHSVAERHGDYLQLQMTGESPMLLADRLHLTNVLHNLLDNAIKYSVGEPTITVSAETSNCGLSISVGDRGIGIPTHLLPQIFQPFFRVHDRNQPSIKGFGLGLSYVQRIIQAHNWTIQVKSEPGQGSEFRIHIPSAALLSQQPGYSAHNQSV